MARRWGEDIAQAPFLAAADAGSWGITYTPLDATPSPRAVHAAEANETPGGRRRLSPTPGRNHGHGLSTVQHDVRAIGALPQLRRPLAVPLPQAPRRLARRGVRPVGAHADGPDHRRHPAGAGPGLRLAATLYRHAPGDGRLARLGLVHHLRTGAAPGDSSHQPADR